MRRYEKGQEVVKGVKIISHIGAGGFGTVYKVSVPGGVEKALKIINLQGTQGVREYNALKLIKKISHPNLVSIDSYWLRDLQGKLLDFSSDDSINAEKQSLELIILMGLGRMSLHDLLMQYINQGKEGIPFAELIKLMNATAEAIDYLNEPHNLGLKEPVAIQHGDIKPGNILLVGNSVQVCDYGLAKAITTSKGARTSIALFSPGYCSPEMNRNQPSNWSDQFSLAISYYELRTGKLPFNEEEEINAGIVAALGKLDFSGVPKAEREVLLKATNPIPNQRYPKCTDFIDALQASGHSSARDSGPKPRSLEEVLQPDSEVVPGYKLVQRISQGERDEFWKATTPAGKPFIIYVIREFRGALGNLLLQSLETLRQLDEFENLINLRNCWMIHADGRAMPYVDKGSLENQTVALVALLDNVDCTLEDYFNECLRKRHSQGIPDHELLQFMMQSAKAIDYLTDVGYTEFLDLKPQTILLTKNKTVKLGIGGLAKRLMSGFSTLTTDRLVNAFAPPELFEVGKHWNSNQYSLALTYFWLRSLGHLPFPADSSPKQIREYHLRGQLDFSDVPEREQNILYNATVLDPNQRFANCYEFVDAMQVAMGVSVPQYAAYSSPHTPTSRITPNRIDNPIPPKVPQEETPTDRTERRQQVTPVVISQQKTPQSPPRKGDPYRTINEVPSLSDGYPQNETQEEISPHEAGHRPPLLEPARPVTPVEVDVEETQELQSAFRQINKDKKNKRRRSALIFSMMGMLLAGVIGAGAVWKLVIEPRRVAVTTPPVETPPVKVPPVVTTTLSPEEITKQIDDELKKQDFKAAWRQIALAKLATDWKEEQQKKVRHQLTAKLNTDVQKYVDKSEFEKAKEEVANQKKQYQELLAVEWAPDWIKSIESKMPKRPEWASEWNAVKSELKGLEDLKQLTSYQAKLKSVADTAVEQADKDKSSALLESVNGLITLIENPPKSEAESLLTHLNKYAAWKQKADPELQQAGCAKAVYGEVLKATRTGFETVDNKENLLKYAPLLTSLLVEKDSPEWLKAGLLEIAVFDSTKKTNQIEELARTFNPVIPYGQFAVAAWWSSTKSRDVLDRWQKVYPANGDWNRQVSMPFRLQLAESSLAGLLADFRVEKDKRCDFKADKRTEALSAIKLLLALRARLPDIKHDEIFLAEQAILDEENTPDGKGTNLRKYTSTPGFETLDMPHQKLINARLLKFGLAKEASITEKINFARTMLNQYQDRVTKEDELFNKVILPLELHKSSDWIQTVPESHKAILANILSELGEDIFFERKDWIEPLHAKQLKPDIVQPMIHSAIQLEPDNAVHYLRDVITQYERGNDSLVKAWAESAERMEKLGGEYFGTSLVKGLARFVVTSQEDTSYSTRNARIEQFNKAEADYAKANELLMKVPVRHIKQYQFLIAMDRSNIALRIANMMSSIEERRVFLDKALQHADTAKKIFKSHPEASDNKGVVLEDYGMLLEIVAKYGEAVEEFENAAGGSEQSVRNKAFLHRGRCYFKWGQATNNRTYYDTALKDLDLFFQIDDSLLKYKIEALYYRAQTLFALADRHKADANDYEDKVNRGINALLECLNKMDQKPNPQWKRLVLLSTFEKVISQVARIYEKYKGDYDKYTKDESYKHYMQIMSRLSSLSTDYPSFKELIAGSVSEYNVKEDADAQKLAFDHYKRSIDIATGTNDPEIDTLTRALRARLILYAASNQSSVKQLAYQDALQGIQVTKKYKMKIDLVYLFQYDASYWSSLIYISDHDSKNWNKSKDHLLDAIKSISEHFDIKRFDEIEKHVVKLCKISSAQDAEKNKDELTKGIEAIGADALANKHDLRKKCCDKLVATIKAVK